MSAVLNKTAVSQVSDAALIEEVNARIEAGAIKASDLKLPETDFEEFDPLAIADEEDEVDWHALEEARARFARRDYPDTLYYLEKALGRDFLGLGDLVLGRS
jgi:hypothetical protein